MECVLFKDFTNVRYIYISNKKYIPDRTIVIKYRNDITFNLSFIFFTYKFIN